MHQELGVGSQCGCGGLGAARLQADGGAAARLAWEGRRDPLAPDSIRLSPGFPRVWGWVPLGLGGPVPWGLERTIGGRPVPGRRDGMN